MGTMNNCLFCNCKTENPKYCSRSCSAKHTNILYPKRKTKKTCSICDEPVMNYRVSHCEKHHNEYLETRFDFNKNLTLADYWDKKSLKELHSSSKNVHIRNLCRSRYPALAGPIPSSGHSISARRSTLREACSPRSARL